MQNDLITKTIQTLKTNGIQGLQKKAKHYIKTRTTIKPKQNVAKDILFINGCSYDLLPHPPRYRVKHQREQLELYGYTTDEVYYKQITNNMIRMYRAFVIFRAPLTKELEDFIQKAKALNKKVIFDIDDLVIDTKYTNQIPYVQTMPKEDKINYDADVNKMGATLKFCDACLTTTKALANELEAYAPTYINRNTASIEMVQASQKAFETKKDHETINIGYFSGSITHNADFESILPALQEILQTYKHVELHITGELDLPKELECFKEQIHSHPFMDYKELPKLIAQMDINLAPLTNTLFNEAKSEIKWIEASLVKVPTIAANFGAFKERIEHRKTGYLCKSLDEWKEALRTLIESKETRLEIANNAYKHCMKHDVTMYTGKNIADIFQSILHPNICFAFSKIEMSGGIMVALRHATLLQEQGYDVTLLSLYDNEPWHTTFDHTFPILPLENKKLDFHLERAVATMWPTVGMLEEIQCAQKKYYLVQNFETDFYDFNDPLKIQAQRSYSPKQSFEFITISKWCQEWLKEDFNQVAKWIYNGIDTKDYPSHKRNLDKKIRILIEGDCQAKHKNVDEAFHIIEKLDPEHYEVWYMSYNAKPKDEYRVDKFLHRIPYEEVGSVYAQCDLLIKTSLLESFSYPPLEMMATGGYVLVIQNDGNKEYLKDKVNCLFYEQGHIDEAIQKIKELEANPNLQDTLYTNGIQTAKERDWSSIKPSIYDAYK